MAKRKWQSAGGVVHNGDRNYIYITLPSNSWGPWCLPKGRMNKGETLKQTAFREILEETGLKVVVGREIGVGVGTSSISTYFDCLVFGGDTLNHDWETEEVRLVTVSEAIKIFRDCGNTRDIDILEKYKKMIANDWTEGFKKLNVTI